MPMASATTMAMVVESPPPPPSLFEASDDEPSIVPSGNVGFWVGDAVTVGAGVVGAAVGAGVLGTPV